MGDVFKTLKFALKTTKLYFVYCSFLSSELSFLMLTSD